MSAETWYCFQRPLARYGCPRSLLILGRERQKPLLSSWMLIRAGTCCALQNRAAKRQWGRGLTQRCSMGPHPFCLPLCAHSPKHSQLSLCLQWPPEKAEEAVCVLCHSHGHRHRRRWLSRTLTHPPRWSGGSCASSQVGTPPGRSAAAPGLS